MLGEADACDSMNQALIAFGVGTRQCGGQNLAQLMMRIVVAVVARNCDVRADVGETNEQSMTMRDAFVSPSPYVMSSLR